MVLRGRHGSSAYVFSLKAHSLAVSLDETQVAAWDRGGRLYSLNIGDLTWRRGLSGQVLEKRQSLEGRTRTRLVPADAGRVVDNAAGIARDALCAVESTAWRWNGDADGLVTQELRTLLRLCARFDAAAGRADAGRFAEVYQPVGILPPDQYLSLVVQATGGCSFNTCTFCDLYHEHYQVKTPAQFRAHVSAVREYLGESIHLRSRGVFLGAANALAVPMPRLLPMFEILAEDMDGVTRGVCAFVDGFTGTHKHTSDYRALRDLGLRRVYVGLESGHDPLLSFVRKPGTAAEAIDTVRAIKDAGVQVGVIVMVGLGGERYATGHQDDTTAALNAMGLGAGDLLYFSELVEMPGTAYPIVVHNEAIAPLSKEARRAQQQAIRSGLRFSGPPPQLAVYDVREFIY